MATRIPYTRAPEIIEDATFIANTGRGLTEAARRLGFNTPTALTRYLQRAGAHELAQRLKTQDWVPVTQLEPSVRTDFRANPWSPR